MPKIESSEMLSTKVNLFPSAYIEIESFQENGKTLDRNAHEMVEKTRNYFNTGITKSIPYRKKQLKALYKMLDENRKIFENALIKDLRKNPLESNITEIELLKNDILSIIDKVAEWAKPRPVQKPLINAFDKLYIHPDPYGVVLVMGAWNYPLELTLSPVIGAIAAGNCVVVKPSEISPASANAMAELIPKYLDTKAFPVFIGGIPETTELLKERFDYIFYTGSTTVGRIVQEAAAKHLTPVTLELGGKSPAFVDSSADMDIAVRRLLWGKFLNSGQTCVAPDYVLCSKETEKRLLDKAKEVIRSWYGEDVKKSKDLSRIVSRKHFDRLIKFLEDENKIALGGKYDPDEKFIEPTILTNISPNDPVMQEEIFGPILPVIVINDIQDAINFINVREKPLALYIFARDKKVKEYILKNTSSGGVGINETIMHLTIDSLPFGGVGFSGMGAYHGKASFDTFTHEKSVLERNYNWFLEKLSAPKYPPYTNKNLKYLLFVTKHRGHLSFSFLWYAFCFMLGIAIALVYIHFFHN